MILLEPAKTKRYEKKKEKIPSRNDAKGSYY